MSLSSIEELPLMSKMLIKDETLKINAKLKRQQSQQMDQGKV